MGIIKLDETGKIADPQIRAAAQALLRCFLDGGEVNEKDWLKWALAATPNERKEIYIMVWRVFLKMPKKPVAKTANPQLKLSI